MSHICDSRALGINKTIIGSIGEHGPLAERCLILGQDQAITYVIFHTTDGNN